MTTKYSDQQFIDAIRKAVEIRGENYTYPSKEEHPEYYIDSTCRYQLESGYPACIIGLALHEIDPALVPAPCSTHLGDRIVSEAGFSLAVARAAGVAQSIQDEDGTWGEALSGFEGYYRRESK